MKMIKIMGVGLLVLGLVFLAKTFHVQDRLKEALEWVQELGPLGPLLFMLIYILACVFSIPGSILTLGAGVVFGVFQGTLYVSLGSILGATAAFLIGRYVARDWVLKKISGNPMFAAIDSAVLDGGWKLVSLIRLSPVFPFNVLNYAFGLTKARLKDYFFGSWIGMLPGTIMYVYVGSLGGSLASLGSGGERARTPMEWVLYGVGLLATVLVTVMVTRVAKKSIHQKMGL